MTGVLPRWDYDASRCEWVREDGQRVSNEEIVNVVGLEPLPHSISSPRVWADHVLLLRGTL